MNDDASRISNDEAAPQPSSQLFTVRIWSVVSAQGVVSWRGKVQAVPGGAWRYFHNWETLTTFLQSQSGAEVAAAQPPSSSHAHATAPVL